MALTHLLDTSVVSRLGAPTVRAVVEPLVYAGRLGRAGSTDLEVQTRLTLLHYDADFDLIANVTGQECEWVVAAGTID